MIWLWLLSLAICLVLVLAWATGIHHEQYWKKRGIKFCQDNKFVGPMWDFLMKDRAFFESFRDIYDKYRNEPAVGVGGFFTPSIIIIHPTNVTHVLQNDFVSFNHRGFDTTKEDKLADNLMFQSGDRWKVVRQNMTPIFTSAKLKNMYYIIDKSAQDFIGYLKLNPDRMNDDTCDTLSSAMSAAISAAVFGIGTESIFDNPLLEMARKSLKPSFRSNLKTIMTVLSPRLANFFGIKVFGEHEDFFIAAIRQVLAERKRKNITMHDFADLCLGIEQKGTMIDRNSNYQVEPSVELFAAQAFFFFIAGVEPCAHTAHATLVELGRHPDYLKAVHDEIDAAFEKHKELNFDIVNGLEVLDKVLNEASRIHPAVATLGRRCTKDTVLPVGNVKIEKGTQINLIPYSYHVDERHYPDPLKFDPERWAPGGGVNKDMFMPFGKGSRICIGARYATLQVKATLVHLLRHYTVHTDVFPGPPKFKKHLLSVRDMKLKVKIIPRNSA